MADGFVDGEKTRKLAHFLSDQILILFEHIYENIIDSLQFKILLSRYRGNSVNIRRNST